MNVRFILKKPSAQQPTPIHMTLTHNGRRKRSIRMSIHPKYWNEKEMAPTRAAGAHGERIQQRINAIRTRVDEIVADIRKERRTVSIEEVLDGLQKNTYPDLLTFTKDYMLNRTNLSVSTIDTYQRVIRYLEEFSIGSGHPLVWASLEEDFFQRFNKFLYTQKSNRAGTRLSYFRVLRTFMIAAKEDGHHKSLKYLKWTLKVKKNRATAFNVEELLQIHFTQVKSEALQKSKDLFVLNCWLGLRFSDWEVNPDFVFDDKLISMNKKTMEEVDIPIHPIAREILDKYGNGIVTDTYNTEYVRLCRLFDELSLQLDFLNQPIPYWEEEEGKPVRSSRWTFR
jgi:hypothetical protein